MKQNRTYLFIAISSVALIVLLIIQVNWILKTAKIKEQLFNEKANMVLSRTTEALCSDKETCEKIGACVDMNNASELPAKLGKTEIHKIDSLFNYYMRFYNFHIDYTYVVAKPQFFTAKNEKGLAKFVFNKQLEEDVSRSGVELKLIFPEKRQYIIAEMGPLFVTSVILILVVLLMFWRTVHSLIKEKQISEHTTDFLNNMTHEFKTPLTNIALAGKMILKEPSIKLDNKLKQYSDIILEENEKLRLQVEQVLSMSALERGEIPLHKTEINLHELIKDSLKCIGIQIENRQGSIDLKLNAEHVLILGDKTHLTNALCNLVDNAIKYSGDKPEISIQTLNDNHTINVVLTDKGIGIDKDFQKKVFEKYFRIPTGNLHNVKGFGLGLAYTKKIVEMHNGIIEIQSEMGKGTKVIITLPNV